MSWEADLRFQTIFIIPFVLPCFPSPNPHTTPSPTCRSRCKCSTISLSCIMDSNTLPSETTSQIQYFILEVALVMLFYGGNREVSNIPADEKLKIKCFQNSENSKLKPMLSVNLHHIKKLIFGLEG